MTLGNPKCGSRDLVCLSHLRWDFVFQRPQHLLTRCATSRRVYFVEEPVFDADAPRMERQRHGSIQVAVPHLPGGLSPDDAIAFQRQLLDELIAAEGIRDFVLWYYTPMAVTFTDHLQPVATVYDCMDELSAFVNAPPTTRRDQARPGSTSCVTWATRCTVAKSHSGPGSRSIRHSSGFSVSARRLFQGWNSTVDICTAQIT